MKRNGKLEKIQAGEYRYRGYILKRFGYVYPFGVMWEAIDPKTGHGIFHGHSMHFLMQEIDEDILKTESTIDELQKSDEKSGTYIIDRFITR